MINLFGYIDPATTAIIWQVLAGIVIALAVVFGIWWRKITTGIRSIWFKLFGKKKDEENKKLSEIDEETSDDNDEENKIDEETSDDNDEENKIDEENKELSESEEPQIDS